MNIRRDELPQALLMFCYFFLVITTFSVLKPLKSGLFIQFYDQSGFDLMGWHMVAAQAELLAKVLNMVIAVVAATVFALLSRSFRRQQLTYVFSVFVIACFLFYLCAGLPWSAHDLVVLFVRRPLQHAHGGHLLRLFNRQRRTRSGQTPLWIDCFGRCGGRLFWGHLCCG